ncbi:hypothetical protein D3C78_1624130 [compost metagenome]
MILSIAVLITGTALIIGECLLIISQCHLVSVGDILHMVTDTVILLTAITIT